MPLITNRRYPGRSPVSRLVLQWKRLSRKRRAIDAATWTIEISMEVQFAVRVIKGKRIRWPRGENAEYIFTVGNATMVCKLRKALLRFS